LETKKYSYSKLDSFNNCPLRYRFIYVDRLIKNDESIEAFLGKIIHSCLEWIYHQKINNGISYFSLDQITNKFKEYWNDRWHSKIRLFQFRHPKKLSHFIKQKKMDYFTLGINTLVNYYSIYGPYFNENVSKIEQKVKFKIDNFNFIAIVDRIDIIDSKNIKIIDYKTGKKSITEKKMLTNLQMGVYSLAAQSIFPEIERENIILSLLYTRNNKEISIKASEINYDALKNKIIQDVTSIESCKEKNNFNPKESSLCNWCYYWNECTSKSQDNPSLYLE
tara:strand:+ start:1734 stop:2567 length:834 start_codon:yes stop_codon:yes gene_type:complete